MTVSSPTARQTYIGDGSTALYSYNFRIFAGSELLLVQRSTSTGLETALVFGVNYTVTGAGNPAGGTFTLLAGVLPSGFTLAAYRLLDLLQSTDLRNQGTFLAEVHERVFDRLMMIAQQLQDQLNRAVRLPDSEAGGVLLKLPTKEVRAGKQLTFDPTTGDPVVSSPSSAAISAAVQPFAASATLALARTALGEVAQTVANLAALKALTGSGLAGYVDMAGYTTAGDGGGGLFRWVAADAATANDGTIVAPTAGGGRFYRVYAGPINVRWFGAVGDGVANDTAKIQAAVNAALLVNNSPVYLPSGTYLVTDTISVYIGTQIVGDTLYQYPVGYGVDPKGSKISFAPTTQRSLFVWTGASHGTGFRFHTGITGLAIAGNSASAAGNSDYALDLAGVIYGNFADLSITGFRTGIRCTATVNNRFCNVYTSGKVSAVRYAGTIETTDTWHNCTFWGSPIGVDFAGTSIAVRFSCCLWEQIDTYGMNISRECIGIMVENCYCEDVPYTNAAAGAMFRVGYAGAVLAVENALTIVGGRFAGRNAGAAGSLIDSDFCNGIQVAAVNVSKWTNVIKASANTRLTSIVVNGMVGVTWANFTADATTVARVVGTYPRGVLNSGSNTHDAAFGLVAVAARVEVPELREVGGASGTIFLDAGGAIIGDGAWNGKPLRLGTKYLWVDSSNRLRIKSSAPASDTDGAVVGTQV